MDLSGEILHWSLGVITSAEADEQDLRHALVRADNMQLTSIAAGKAWPRTRKGMTLVNETPFSNTSASAGPAIVGGGHYPYLNAGATSLYNVLVMANGDVHVLSDDGASTDLTPADSFVGELTADLTSPDYALMENRVFVQDGKGGRTSLLGLTTVDWGVSPVTGLALVDTGAGDMTGDYDILVTGWNSQTEAESDRSAVVSITGLASEQLQVTVDAVAVGLTHRFFRIYIRKPSLGSGFFRVTSGTGYDADQEGFPLFAAGATTSTTINISDATLTEVLVEAPPQLNARGLPPAGSKFVVPYQRRLFVADEEGVYWSELDKPDAFNPLSYEPIKNRDPRGGNVVGMRVHAGLLHIFTETARITLAGETDLRSWVWDIADPDVGAVSNRAIITYKKWMFWWDKEHGPVMMDSLGGVSFIGEELIRNDIKSDVLNASRLWEVVVAASDGHVMFSVPFIGQTNLTHGLAFNTQLNRWESTRWDPMNPSYMFGGFDSSKNPILYLGNYNGQLFRLLQGGNDGVRSGTDSGTFVAATASISEITDAAAAFDTTGAGLIERKVTIVDSEGLPITSIVRPSITANTATNLTLSDTVAGLEVGETYTYYVGGPDLVLETFWDHMQAPFVRKRFDRLFMEFRSDTGLAEVHIGVAVNSDSGQASTTEVALEGSGDLWDDVDWDVFFWDSPAEVTYGLPIIRSGRNYRVQIRNPRPNQGITLLKMDMLAHARGDRYRRGY